MSHRGRHLVDDLLAAALAAGRTVRDAAGAAGVSEKTAHRRNADPAFRARAAALRADMVAAAAAPGWPTGWRPAGVLRALLADPDPHVRHKAAVKLVELGVRVRDQTDLEDRLRRLEADLPDRPGPGAACNLGGGAGWPGSAAG